MFSPIFEGKMYNKYLCRRRCFLSSEHTEEEIHRKTIQSLCANYIGRNKNRVETFLIFFYLYPWPLSLPGVLSLCKCRGKF